MQWYEILIIIAAVLFVLGNIGVYVYKKIKHKPTGCCAECHDPKKMNNNLNKIRKELNEEHSCPHCNSK